MGAVAALKGYRVQFLYCLYRILSGYGRQEIYQPEGKFEDLDILDEALNYLEVVQVKNNSGTLQFADLFSSLDSFFARGSRVLERSPLAILKVVAFGPVSQELTDGEKLKAKLIKKGFNPSAAALLVSRCSWEQLSEDALEQDVLGHIKRLNLFTDPYAAMEILLFWLYITGENGKSIRGNELVDKIGHIGKFVSGQAAINQQFGTLIRPFTQKPATDDKRYKEEFYYGVSARYEHILAGLDVHREDKLEAIHAAFSRDNIVFIHAASGQGKSTLAYRYIYEYTDGVAAYELKVSQGLKQVYDTINSLEALSSGLDFPVLLYIDIKPEDTLWNEIVKALYYRKNLKFLVTIRSEDWNRTFVKSDYSFSEIDLTFDKAEAERIYNYLNAHRKDLIFVDFEESWRAFGGTGMLLEYVYLINQGTPLRERLREQVRRIEERVAEKKTDELEILRLVCTADAYNAKISYRELVKKLDIRTPQLYIDYFKEEYLLQFSDDRDYITGLHPIRSAILCEILFEGEYVSHTDYLMEALPLVHGGDLQIYLMESFKSGIDVNLVVGTLKNMKVNSWRGYSGIINALLWKGMYDFVFLWNIGPIEKLRAKFEGLWEFSVPFNFANEEQDGGLFSLFESHYPDDLKAEVRDIHKEFTPMRKVYQYLEQWLRGMDTVKAACFSSDDLRALGETCFWLSWAKTDVAVHMDTDSLVALAHKNASLRDLAVLLFGLYHNKSDSKEASILRELFIEKLRKEFDIIRFEVGTAIEVEYIYDPLAFDTANEAKAAENFLQKSRVIVNLLRYAFPEMLVYKVRSHGSQFFDITLPHDPTALEIARENLPNPFLVTLNALFGNIYKFEQRCADWQEYVTAVLNNRRQYVAITGKLIDAFEKHFRDGDLTRLLIKIDEIQKESKSIRGVSYPKSISDPWGYLADGSNLANVGVETEETFLGQSLSALIKYSNLQKYERRYFNNLSGFYNTLYNNAFSIAKMKLNIMTGHEYNPYHMFTSIKAALKNIYNFEAEFSAMFLKYYDEEDVEALHDKEVTNLEILYNCWHQFYFKKGRQKGKVARLTNKNFRQAKSELTQKFRKERQAIAGQFGIYIDVCLSTKVKKKALLLSCRDVTADDFNLVLVLARQLLQKTIKCSYTSIRSVIIDYNIDEVIYVPCINGKAINRSAIGIYIHNLDEEITEGQTYFNPFITLDDDMAEALELEFWNEQIPLVGHYEKVLALLVNMYELNRQLSTIKERCPEADTCSDEILTDYQKKIEAYIVQAVEEVKMILSDNEALPDGEIFREVSRFLKNVGNDFTVLPLERLKPLKEKMESDYRPWVERVVRDLQEEVE